MTWKIHHKNKTPEDQKVRINQKLFKKNGKGELKNTMQVQQKAIQQ